MPAIVLDTNLLVLLVVGATSKTLIGVHDRLAAYSEADFDLLNDYLAAASQIVVTPHTLTESSNLLRQIRNPARDRISATLKALIGRAEERFADSQTVAEHADYLRLGLTDCALMTVAAGDEELLTVDLDLYLAALRRGGRAVNFNHVRVEAGLLP
jgi:predicted nucleic acid-binding protein